MIRYVVLVLGLLCAMDSDARTKAEKAACAKVKEQIKTVESKMRSGYSRAQGEKYEAKLRELRAERRHLCR